MNQIAGKIQAYTNNPDIFPDANATLRSPPQDLKQASSVVSAPKAQDSFQASAANPSAKIDIRTADAKNSAPSASVTADLRSKRYNNIQNILN